MTLGEMTDLADKLTSGLDLEMLCNIYERMWVDFFYTNENKTIANCAQMYIIGLAIQKFDNNRADSMMAGASTFASLIGKSPADLQNKIEEQLNKGKIL